MSPGTYLRLRREAAGLSVPDVALMLASTRRAARTLEQQIARIEDGTTEITQSTAQRLRDVFRFDTYVLGLLREGSRPFAPPICKRCGCSDLDLCDDERLGPCAWASPARDLCTACVEPALRASGAA